VVAAWCCFAEGDPAAQTWVHDHARSILDGRVSVVAAAIRRKATRNHLDAAKRKPADTAASYLLSGPLGGPPGSDNTPGWVRAAAGP
jgi:hypothetical protein